MNLFQIQKSFANFFICESKINQVSFFFVFVYVSAMGFEEFLNAVISTTTPLGHTSEMRTVRKPI